MNDDENLVLHELVSMLTIKVKAKINHERGEYETWQDLKDVWFLEGHVREALKELITDVKY